MIQKPRVCKRVDDIEIGDRVCLVYCITNDDVIKFAEISGDWNPIHFDEEFAAKSIFRKRIAHGMISLAKFSGIFGMDLPGLGTLWENQDVRFLKPVFLNISYTAIAVVKSKDRRQITLSTWVEDGDGQHVLEGTAVVRPISQASYERVVSYFGRSV
jgi:3-hydroxybutyryl-CoA dehydratase